MARFAGFIVAALLVAACAGPQPSFYAPKDGRDGYVEEELPKGLYIVSFQGNSVTSRKRAEDYALYRAAELTIEMGAEAFVVHDKLTEQLTRVTRDVTYGPWGYPGYRHRTYGYRSPRVIKRESTTFLAQLTIEPYSGPAPSEGFQRHAARAVLDRLAAEILRPPQEAAQ